MYKKIKCPILNEEIEDIVCFDICMVAEGMAPVWTMPAKVFEVKDFKKICLNCVNHRE